MERRYYLSSLVLTMGTFARSVQGHWGVETQLHWELDASFLEHQSRAQTGYWTENLAILRRLALNLLKQERTKRRGIKGKQLNADHGSSEV